MERRELEGTATLTVIWYEVARRVVETAIKVYGLTPEQSDALSTSFLQFRDYRVEDS